MGRTDARLCRLDLRNAYGGVTSRAYAADGGWEVNRFGGQGVFVMSGERGRLLID